MIIAIVGASKPTENEEILIREQCLLKMWAWKTQYVDLTIISGGARGVDTIAEKVAKECGIPFKTYKPSGHNWEAYKERNIKIAESCDELLCFPTKLVDKPCYHCNTDEHERSGGCWTAKKAKELGKTVKIIPPTNDS